MKHLHDGVSIMGSGASKTLTLCLVERVEVAVVRVEAAVVGVVPMYERLDLSSGALFPQRLSAIFG